MPLIRTDLQTYPSYQRPPGEDRARARLHLNEAPEGWPEAPRRALLERLAQLPFQRYPERQGELTERLARILGAPEGGVLLGPSSGALLDLIALAGLDPGDAVAIPEPGFSLYPALAARHRARALRVAVGDGFSLEPWLALLEQACPRQLWLTLPNNPTGAWLSPECLQPLLEAAARQPEPPLVVLDEAYGEFAPRTHRLAVDRYPNLVLLRTFSKALASAGWRLGYAVGAPELIRALAALQLPYSLPSPALEALDVALDFPEAFAAQARRVPERRDRLARALGDRALNGGGNFLLVRPDPGPALAEAGLQTRSLGGLGAGRITVGSEAEARRTARALGAVLAAPEFREPRRLRVLGPGVSAGSAFTGLPPDWVGQPWDTARLPAAEAAPHLRCPSPCGLLQLADEFRAVEIVFSGAGPAQALALDRARAARPELSWRFAQTLIATPVEGLQP